MTAHKISLTAGPLMSIDNWVDGWRGSSKIYDFQLTNQLLERSVLTSTSTNTAGRIQLVCLWCCRPDYDNTIVVHL